MTCVRRMPRRVMELYFQVHQALPEIGNPGVLADCTTLDYPVDSPSLFTKDEKPV
jgi:hypothetical protein